MPVAGRKPKEDGSKRNRVKPVHDWLEIEDVPYAGDDAPNLPTRRTFMTKEGPTQLGMVTQTKRWWATVSSMPHCVLWTAADWQFALTTAFVADDVFRGDSGRAAELRQREKVMGTTMDSRRDLRIRYVDPEPDTSIEKPSVPKKKSAGTVTSISEGRRARLTSDAS